MTSGHVAFLVMAHTDPASLRRLCARLGAPWASVFVHIDARAAIEPFRDALATLHHVSLLGDHARVAVNWAGYSQVRAAQTLFAAALALPNITRFCLLSGSDYPIKPLAHIRTALDDDAEYVSIDRIVDGNGNTPQDRFLRYRFAGDFHLLNERTSPLPMLALLAKKLAQRFPRTRLPTRALYHGANWCALTREGARRVVELEADDPDMAAFLRRTQSADEFVAQSVVKRPPALRIAHLGGGDRRADRVYGVHYIDWTTGLRDRPKTLVEADMPMLLATPALFARKFDAIQSAGLLDAIDRTVLDHPPADDMARPGDPR